MQLSFSNAEEDMAASFLRLIGLTILSRNARNHGAELDFICKAGEEFFIVEVKRASPAKSGFFKPLSFAQRARLIRSAKEMQRKADKFLTVRILLLLVNVRSGAVRIFVDI